MVATGGALETPQVVKASRRFVSAMLSQVLLEAMPVSWVAWSGKLAEAIENLPERRLEVMADALALPHDMTESTLTHAILSLIAPDRLQGDQLFGYLVEVAKVRTQKYPNFPSLLHDIRLHRYQIEGFWLQIWQDLGVNVTPEEVHVIRHLTPRIVERLSNMHGSPEEDGVGRLVNEQFLIEVASSLGTMDTSSLMQLKAALHTMTSDEVHDAVNVRIPRFGTFTFLLVVVRINLWFVIEWSVVLWAFVEVFSMVLSEKFIVHSANFAVQKAFDGILHLMGTTKEEFRDAVKMISSGEGPETGNQVLLTHGFYFYQGSVCKKFGRFSIAIDC